MVRELARQVKPDVRLGKDALLALQEGAEQHVVQLFKNAQTFAIHANRQTIVPDDLALANAESARLAVPS